PGRSVRDRLVPALALLTLSRGAEAVEYRLPGDVNGDSRVTLQDTVLSLRAVIGLEQLNAPAFDAADLAPEPGVGPKAGKNCGDGVLNILDAVATIKLLYDPAANIAPTFANIQREVFNESCAFSSCHSEKSKRGGLILEEGKAYENLVNVTATLDGDKPDARLRVAPGNPDGSFLLTKLTHPGPDDGEMMPVGTENGLAPSKIKLIRDWILRGAPNDGTLDPVPDSGNTKVPVDPNYDEIGDVQLAPPPPGEGVQLVIPAFAVPKGKEIQRNYYMKLPVDEDVEIQKIEFAFNPGSHHLNIFKSDTEDYPDSFTETYSAVDWQSWYLVVDSQNGSLGWQLPPGVAIRLKARQQMNLQIHYVNVGDQRTRNNRGKAIVNFWFAKKGTVTSHLGALFAQNRNIYLPPHTYSEFTKTVIFPHDVKILAMTGHFHSRGKQFYVNRWDGKNIGEEVYRSLAWGDPPFKIYERPVEVKKGEGLIYTTTYYNDTDKPIKFGAQVDIEEHSNLFVFFTPGLADGKAIYDF
ncbi:MAG: hypothetical protein KY468_17425, partial [Armatimonadetes bacterium]|nr:hypothetical protein [Armatimonadota bacterium]